MPLEKKKYDIEANNDWAQTVKEEHLYIDDAESGRNGYFCIGCGKQMEAVKRKNRNHKSYFRHVPVDVKKDLVPCTFSNREYREILAADILQRLKFIKVPTVYKYPPYKEDGAPILLEQSKFIYADKVKSQLIFFEDEDGSIGYGKNVDVEERYLLMKPDIVFFDVENKPILFIELVDKHKVTEEKKINLRRLGIDTVSIIVPKSSEKEIEDNFKSTQRVKWEFNGKEANTKYVSVSDGSSEGILEPDEYQRRVFEESINCRKARLNNTLRTIEKCLGTEYYRRAEQYFESEISRIEESTRSARERLGSMESEYEKDVFEELGGQFQEFETRGEAFGRKKAKFSEYVRGLEKRYLSEARRIDNEQKSIQDEQDVQREHGQSENAIRKEFEDIEDGFKRHFNERKGEVTRLNEAERREIEEIERETSQFQPRYSRAEDKIRNDFNKEEAEIEERRRTLQKRVDNELAKQIRQGTTEGLPEGTSPLLEAERMGNDFKIAASKEDSYKRARELFKTGTWKTW